MSEAEIAQRITKSLESCKDTKSVNKTKMFCLGYITALFDNEQIPEYEYLGLRDTINMHKVGCTYFQRAS